MFGKGINQENNKDHISQSRGSALDDEKLWRMEDCTRGSSLVNHEARLQTLWWRMHEQKRNSWGLRIKGEDGGLH